MWDAGLPRHAQPSARYRVGLHCLEFAGGAETCPCSPGPYLGPGNDGHFHSKALRDPPRGLRALRVETRRQTRPGPDRIGTTGAGRAWFQSMMAVSMKL